MSSSGPLIETPLLADGYFEVDRAGNILRVSRKALALYGLDDADVARALAGPPDQISVRVSDLVAAKVSDPETFGAGLRRHLSAPEEETLDYIPMRDGRVLERYGVPVRDAGGAVTGRAAYLRDVTRRWHDVELLRERAERSEALSDLGELALHAGDLDALALLAVRLIQRTTGADLVHILQLDPAGRLLTLRQTSSPEGDFGTVPVSVDAGSFSGFTLASNGSVVSSDLVAESRFIAPRLRDLGVRAGIATVIRGREPPRGVLGAFWKAPRSFLPEEVRFVEAAANVLAAAYARADAEARLLAREDEARAMQARLALADRMASVGTLAAGVAHELNNPLAYVMASHTFLAEAVARLAAGAGAEADRAIWSELADAIREAREGAERMRDIIRDLKTFSRVDETRSGPVDLREVLESCVSMAWNEIRYRAQLLRELGDVPMVRGNAGKLGQVFLNLLVNAAQSLPEGAADRNAIRIVTRPWPGNRVAVEVRDTGCGIPAEVRPRIFDPFFTTKAVGEGTGLGLTICHNIVTAEGGSIEVESAVGQGSTFRVLLPAAASSAEQATPAPLARNPGGRRGRILVVDDEPLVGTAVRRTLGAEHDVTVVGGARQALERLGQEPFDLVVTDLLMPEVTGMELHAELQRRDAPLAGRTIFLTGGAFTPAARSFVEEHWQDCVEKPFDARGLRELVRSRLAGL